MTKQILIPLANGCEELEAITIADLLTRAGFKVTTASLTDEPVTASRGTRLLAGTSLDEALGQSFDLIVLPGGQPGTNNLMNDDRIIELVRKQYQQKKLLAAICAAPRVLVHAGVARNHTVTSFPGALEGMNLTDVDWTADAVVCSGHIITSRGPGTAMAFALALIERLSSSELRREVEEGLVA